MMIMKILKNFHARFLSLFASKVLLSFFIGMAMVGGPLSNVTLAKKNVGLKQGVEASNKKIANKIEEYKKRLESLLSPIDYHYVAAGKPDPFKPFLRTEMGKGPSTKSNKVAKKPDRCETALECMDVGQLTLVGIVLEPNGKALAMAQDASGIGYTLGLGTRIGYNQGQVVAITRDRVVVKEKVEDLRGKPTYRERILYLHPEEGDESS